MLTKVSSSSKVDTHRKFKFSIFAAPGNFLANFVKIRNFHYFFVIFGDHTQQLLRRVRSSTEAEIYAELSFNMI